MTVGGQAKRIAHRPVQRVSRAVVAVGWPSLPLGGACWSTVFGNNRNLIYIFCPQPMVVGGCRGHRVAREWLCAVPFNSSTRRRCIYYVRPELALFDGRCGATTNLARGDVAGCDDAHWAVARRGDDGRLHRQAPSKLREGVPVGLSARSRENATIKCNSVTVACCCLRFALMKDATTPMNAFVSMPFICRHDHSFILGAREASLHDTGFSFLLRWFVSANVPFTRSFQIWEEARAKQ